MTNAEHIAASLNPRMRAEALAENAPAQPDPRVTGPCQLQASPFCTGEGIQRLDPMDMLDASTSFARHVSACLDCYEARADRYVKEVHAR